MQALWEVEAGAEKYRLRRLDWALALVLVLAAGGLRFYHLSQPNELVFDEVYFVEQGKNYLRGKEFMDPHPPLAKLAIGASVALFGGEASGYRVFNAVCGTLLVGVAYLSGRKVLGDGLRRVAAAVTMDGSFIVDSRIAICPTSRSARSPISCSSSICGRRPSGVDRPFSSVWAWRSA
jgi:dolichyl-phosphate-mannose--protein O-mannosyl transferase